MSDIFWRTTSTSQNFWQITPKLRWFIDYDGERILQQAYVSGHGEVEWRRIEEVVKDE